MLSLAQTPATSVPIVYFIFSPGIRATQKMSRERGWEALF